MLEIQLAGNKLQFIGKLDCNTVVAHWPFKLLAQLPTDAEFDLAGLAHVDTAGLAWLLQQLAQAKQRGINVVLLNMPQQLRSLATVSDVLTLLPVR
jgi:phospholipid transport system transporter-binding protein